MSAACAAHAGLGLQARPACHHLRDSIEAHLTVAFGRET